MSCNCNKQEPMPTPSKPRKGVVKFCDICDPCSEAATNVRICAFVVPTLEEGRYFKNSFIFVQEDDSVYFISDDRSEIPFGSRPKFIDNFNPLDSANSFKNTVVYDLAGQAGYVYGPDGNYMTISLAATPITGIVAGGNAIVTSEGGVYTIAVDMEKVAKAEDLQSITTLVTGHTTQIKQLNEDLSTLTTTVETLTTTVDHVHDVADAAAENATLARTEATEAYQAAREVAETVATKQNRLTAGANIAIEGDTISALLPAYEKATVSANGLMSNVDRQQLINVGIYEPDTSISATAATLSMAFTQYTSDADGSNYGTSTTTVTFPAATTSTAGIMSAADKTKLNGVASGAEVNVQSNWTQTNTSSDDYIKNKPVVTYTTTDPGAGGTLAANNFIIVYEA